MANGHISFSEFKIWSECPWRHKLSYLDKLSTFNGNKFTAFGTAVHEVCERTAKEEKDQPPEAFQAAFSKELKKLNGELNKKLVVEMNGQGKAMLPEIFPALKEYFGEYEIIEAEAQLYEPIKDSELLFKGFIDLVLKTEDGKYHIIDWKTCSWGWDARKKSDKLITYQLTLYKNYYVQKHNLDPKNVETHFALLKRTAKKNRVEIFRVTSGERKMKNALKALDYSLYNIEKSRFVKNRLSCKYCEFYQTKHCP